MSEGILLLVFTLGIFVVSVALIYNLQKSRFTGEPSFAVRPENPPRGESVEFEAHAEEKSRKPRDDSATFEWHFTDDDSTEVTGQSVTHTFNNAGEYEVKLKVTDRDGETHNKTRDVSVRPETLWTIETDGCIDSSPTVVDGAVYFGSWDSNLYAVDAETGEQEWAFDTGSMVESSPTVVDGTVFVGSFDGKLYAVDAATGEQEWVFQTDGELRSSPTVVDGTVYVGSDSTNLFAVDAATGAQEWVFSKPSAGLNSSPTVADGTVYIGSQDSNLYAVDVVTGTQEWIFTQPSLPITSSPTVSAGTLYIGSRDKTLYAVDATTGTGKWAFAKASAWVDSSPTVADGTVYVGCRDSTLYAVDAETGDKKWSFTQPSWGVDSSPTIADGTVYAASRDGTLYAVDVETGEKKWVVTQLSSETASSPIVADGTVYIGSGDGTLYAMETELAGSSRDSRIMLGTLGHHSYWHYAEEALEPPAEFDVSVVETSSPVERGEPVDVTVAVENSGHGEATQTVEVSYDTAESETETRTLTLDPEERASETFALSTADIGSHDCTVTAATADDTDTATVTVRQPAAFMITDTEVTSPVDGGDDIDVTVTVANDGDQQDTQAVELSAEDIGSDSDVSILTLNGQEETTESLSIATAPDDSGESTLTVATEDDSVTESVTVLRPPTVEVSTLETNAPVETDETLDVTAEVRNVGDSATTQPIEIDIEGVDSTTREQALDSGESGTLSLSLPATALGSGRCTITVSSEDDSITETVSVLGPAAETSDETVAATAAETADAGHDSLAGGRAGTAGDGVPIPDALPSASPLSIEYDDMEKGEVIGRGGNADVYRATATTAEGETTFALKEPRMSGTLHTETVERMLTEAETWQQLDDHDHIVGVLDYGAEPLPWIGMEYMDAGHLGERSGDLPLDQTLWTALAVTKAVRHAHDRGVAHLDLKPENVLFRAVEDAWDVPKVADWGLSKHLLEHSKSVEGMSPHYAAPEQFDTDAFGATDNVTDIYQLGAVFYELFTGRPPFEGQTFEVVNKVQQAEPQPPSEVADMPAELDDVLLRALATEKSERYEHVLYLRDELQTVFDEL